MPSETVELEAIGERLSHHLIPRIRTYYNDVFHKWNVEIACSIPTNTSKEEKQKLKEALRKKKCHGKCS